MIVSGLLACFANFVAILGALEMPRLESGRSKSLAASFFQSDFAWRNKYNKCDKIIYLKKINPMKIQTKRLISCQSF